MKNIALKIAKDVLSETAGQYRTINDAERYERGLAKGSTEIWYTRYDNRDAFTGYSILVDKGTAPDPDYLRTTHVLIGKIRETNLNKIFKIMQGDNWSPEGEANGIIGKLDTHTSMSVGDIIVKGGKTYFVDSSGFEQIS